MAAGDKSGSGQGPAGRALICAVHPSLAPLASFIITQSFPTSSSKSSHRDRDMAMTARSRGPPTLFTLSATEDALDSVLPTKVESIFSGLVRGGRFSDPMALQFSMVVQ